MKYFALKLLLIYFLLVNICIAEASDEFEPDLTWPEKHKEVARKAFLYAQMSSNTYGQAGDTYNSDGLDFILPSDWKSEHFGNNEIGFAYSIYRKYEGDSLKEVVIAFRGTEGLTNFDDVLYGNILAQQNPMAIEVFNKVKQEIYILGMDIPIVLTGHSLGGGLAIHTAINVSGAVPYFVFNSSPRFSKLRHDQGGDSSLLLQRRHSIVETNEFLYAARFPSIEADQLYTPFNCDKYFKPFSSHSIEKLATCLTMIASLDNPMIKLRKEPKSKALN